MGSSNDGTAVDGGLGRGDAALGMTSACNRQRSVTAVATRTVILTGPEAEILTATLSSVEQRPTPAVASVSPVATVESAENLFGEAAGKEVWQVYYDNDAFALTNQGWWLRREGDLWLLRVPMLVAGMPRGLFTEVTTPADILQCLGLESSAERVRSGKAKNIERLLAEVGVRPFAKLCHIQRSVGRLRELPAREPGTIDGAVKSDASLGLTAKADTSRHMEVEVTVDIVHFDVNLAENAAFCDVLFTRGTDAFRAAVAEFAVGPVRGDRNSADTLSKEDEARALLFSTLQQHGLDRWEPPVGLCPKVLAYMWAFRPAHFRQLARAGAIPPWTPPGMTPMPPPIPPVPVAASEKPSGKVNVHDDPDMVE